MDNKKILFIVNVDWFFASHRLPIALEAIKYGYEVHVATTVTDRSLLPEGSGLIIHSLHMHRSRSGAIFSEFFEIFSVIRAVSPDVLHLVTIKPVLFGGLAARLIGVRAVVSAVSGLGFVFVSRGLIALFRRKIILFFYRLALGHSNQRVIFQNTEDCAQLSKLTHLSSGRSILIPGSGVDLSLYRKKTTPDGAPIIMFVGRLLIDKGVREFVRAAELFKGNEIQARFVLVGSVDPSTPSSIQQSELTHWRKNGVVELWGNHNNMKKIFPLSTIVVLPSYREGFPKVLIEAAACGCATVTTNVPGCRDAIKNGETGLLVPVKNANAIYNAILSLLKNPCICREMGEAGRRLAEEKFDIRDVVDKHMKIYRDLLKAT